MLCINSYSPAYIADCRERINIQLATYQKLVETSPDQATVIAFESAFFNNMVLLLDSLFCHRSRTMEKKDGNPLNEVRLICEGLLYHQSRMSADKSIKLDPARSILKYQVGEEIKLTQADFMRLAEAFFVEIESKYSEQILVG